MEKDHGVGQVISTNDTWSYKAKAIFKQAEIVFRMLLEEKRPANVVEFVVLQNLRMSRKRGINVSKKVQH